MNTLTGIALLLDPVLMMERAGLAAYSWQADVLRNRASSIIVVGARQAPGKSTCAQAAVAHEMLAYPGTLCLLVAPSLRQSSEGMRGVMRFLHANLNAVSIGIVQQSVLSVELTNHSRCLALPGSESSARSWASVSLAVIDEAARVSDSTFDAIFPTLAVSNGRRILLSTPFGQRGTFYRLWTQGAGWHRVEVPASACPSVTAEFLEAERARLPADIFAQEYECSFSGTDYSLFSEESLRAALDDSFTPLFLEREREPVRVA